MKRTTRRRMGFRIIAAAVVVLCVILGVNKHKLDEQYAALSRKEASLAQQIEEEKERALDIEEYRIYITTKKFIQDFAGSVMGLVKPEDIIIKEGE